MGREKCSWGDTSKESIKMRRCDNVGTARIGASFSSERQVGLIIFWASMVCSFVVSCLALFAMTSRGRPSILKQCR